MYRPVIARTHVNRLKLFGGAALDASSGPITGRAAQRHRVALLALLSTTKRLHRSRDQLMTLLWPNADAERGRRLLSDSIYRINQALGGDTVTGTADEIRLNRHRLSTDIADFEAAVDERDWPRVVDLYDGPFLESFYLPSSPEFDQWMEIERFRYARNVGKALEALANDAHQAGKPEEALEWWQRYSTLAPDGSRVATEVMRVLDADQLAKRRDVVASLSPRCNSIAVLPFNNVTGSDAHAHLADAVSEELMEALTRTPGVHVASRTSAFAYRGLRLDVRDVARRLRVAWILEGSVRRSGRTLRVAAQLTDASNGYQVWSDTVDHIATDDRPIEAEIAGEILARLAEAMGGRFAVQRGMLMRERSAGNCVEMAAS